MEEINLDYDLNQLELIKKMGEGASSYVFIVKNKQTGEEYVAKIIRPDYLNLDGALRNIIREMEITPLLQHPAIICVIGLSKIDFHNHKKPVLILKYMKNGSLKKLISKNDVRITDTTKLIILYGVASAMSFLHSNEIIHRDLKLDNVLIDEQIRPQVCDFGLSKSLKSVSFDNSNYKGAGYIMAPEVFEEEYTKESDVFSFAMLAYELITGIEPFDGFTKIKVQNEIKKGNRPKFSDDIPDAYMQLIEGCWSDDPNERPSFDEIVNNLENNKDFITDSIDENEYLEYVQLIKKSPKKFFAKEYNNLSLQLHKQFYKDNINYFKTNADENNDPISMFYYAVLLYNGDGTKKDDQKAALYFKKSADNGVVGAMFNYGFFHQNGIGCEKK